MIFEEILLALRMHQIRVGTLDAFSFALLLIVLLLDDIVLELALLKNSLICFG